MRRLFVMSIGLAVATLALLGGGRPAPAQGPATQTIRFAYPYPNVENAPIYVANAEGFFRDEHLNVESIALSSGDKITFALLGGSVEIGNYTPDWFIRAIEKGENNLRIVLGCSNIPVYSLMVTNDIRSYADLKTKRVGVSTVKASDAYLVRRMLAAHGLAESDYILIQAGSSPDRAAALRSGSIAATLISPPIDAKMMEEGGSKRLDVSSSVVKHYTWESQAIREDWAQAHKPALIGFMRAWIRATRWLYDPKNKDAAVAILARELKLEDRYARGAYEMYFEGEAETIAKDGKIDLVGLQELINAIVAQGDMPAPPPKPDKYLDLSYWTEAMASLK